MCLFRAGELAFRPRITQPFERVWLVQISFCIPGAYRVKWN